MLFEARLYYGYYEGDLQLWASTELRVHYDANVSEIEELTLEQRKDIEELVDAELTKWANDNKIMVAFVTVEDIDFAYEMCPYCGEDIKLDAVEEASFEDHGKCHSCHKEWQMNCEGKKED